MVANPGTANTDRPRFFVGPSGWSYPDWAGVVYPADAGRKFDALAHIAKYFTAVEVNTSFYRPVSARMTASWVRRVADQPHFRFTFKLHQAFTHNREGYSQQDVQRFLTGLQPVAEASRLGCILMQFPWSFRRSGESVAWLRRLAVDFAGQILVVELRHDSWAVAETLAELSDMGVGICNIDQPQLSHCVAPSAHVTGGVGYVRFHGRRQATWFARDIEPFERYNYLYSSEELGEWLPRLEHIGASADTVYVFSNNHYRGQGPANALQLRAILEGGLVKVPTPLLGHFPHLATIHREEGTPFPETLF